MDRQAQFAAELRALRALCDGSNSPEETRRLIQSLSHTVFVEPEHHVVFESIRAVLARGPLSVAQLRVHLNNRGFPDTDVEKYFQTAPPDPAQQESPNKVAP